MDYRKPAEVAILIRGWGNTDLTRSLLRSIRDNTEGPSHSIYYVDNGSDVAEFAEVLMEFPEACHIRLPFNHGSCRAINVGVAMAALTDAKYFLLLDNDTEVPKGDKGWLKRMVGYFDEEKVGAVGAVTDRVSGRQNCEALPDFYQKDWTDADKKRGGYKNQPNWPVLVSFAMMVRRDALRDIGWFADEQFEPGNAEDYDLCLRMNQKGWQCRIATSVWIHHKCHTTFKKIGLDNLLQSNMAKLTAKYGGRESLLKLGLRVA